jgi:TPR repeat protein
MAGLATTPGKRIRHSAALAAALLLLLGRTAIVWGDPLDDAVAAQARRDYATALRLLRPLAEAGDPVAQKNLGDLYDHGWGVPQDQSEGVKWYRKAAEQGYADAQFELGVSYEIGRGVPKDYSETAKWLLRAAEQGQGDAQGSLGELYSNGDGVAQDLVQAHLWLSLALRHLPDGMRRNLAREDRERVSAKMSPAQLAEAHRLAREWKPK